MKDSVTGYTPQAVLAAAAMPWAWSVAFVPAWVSLMSAACTVAVVALLAGYRGMRKGRDAEDGDPPISGFLNRWSGIAGETEDHFDGARSQTHGVTEQTGRAVINIADSFRTIKERTSAQMAHAADLIRNAGAEAGGSDAATLSLSGYVRLNAEALDRLADDVLHLADAYAQVLSLENDMQTSDQKLERYVDDTHALLQRVGMLAEKARDQALANQIDALACDALKAGNILRNHMHSLRRSRSETCKAICEVAARARDAAEAVKHDRAQLQAGMRRKSGEIAALVERINALGDEVRRQVYRVIVELQFHTITPRRPEKVRMPLLNGVGQGLRAIAQETQHVYDRLRRAGGEERMQSGADPEAQPPASSRGNVAGTTRQG